MPAVGWPKFLGMAAVVWVLETEVFPETSSAMIDAVRSAGHDVIRWRDAWLAGGAPMLTDRAVVFHGSLGNAAVIRERFPWRPGSYCNAAGFHCSAWYPRARRWLVHDAWVIATAESLVADPAAVLAPLDAPSEIFVRPDSPLKPFSGRVVARDRLTLRALDHGFYYEDASLPVVAAPVRRIGREWRYVVVDRGVVAGSAYAADGRTARPDDPSGAPWRFAQEIAAALDPPETVYVLDVCECDGALRLLELNPFSGADLYACSRPDVVAAVSALAAR